MTNSTTSTPLETSQYKPVPRLSTVPLGFQQKKKRAVTWKRAQRIWHQGWGAEAYGMALAASSLVAIIAVIASFDGKTLPEWPMHITINAMIAVFTVLMKAGLGLLLAEGISQLKWQWFQKEPRRLMDLDDFDNASRGVLGSMTFLFKIPQREIVNNFAKFAAALTILAAVVDPFSQQIVGVVECTRESDQLAASVGRTNAYYANGGHTGAQSSEIDSPMAVAINVGLVNPPNHIPSLVSSTCSSGNCTFGRFSSVAVCHSCSDISSQIRNLTKASGPKNYSLPDSDDQGFGTLGMAAGVLLNTSASTTVNYLLDLRIISRGGDINLNPTPNAFQCQLFPCVRTYEANISKTVLQETVVSKTTMGFDAYGGLGRYVLAASNLTQNGQQTIPCTPHATNDTTGLVLVANANADAAPPEPRSSGSKAEGQWYPEECVWIFGASPWLAMRQELRRYLDGNAVQYVPGTYVADIVGKNLWRNATTSFDSVDAFMRNLSDVVTATVRNNGANGTGDYALGSVVLDTTCVEVRWAWLSFPAALVGLGFVFLLMLVVQSPGDSRAVRSWKSSNLAVLFCSLDEAIRQETDLSWFRDEIDDVAMTSRAQLIQDGAGKARFAQE